MHDYITFSCDVFVRSEIGERWGELGRDEGGREGRRGEGRGGEGRYCSLGCPTVVRTHSFLHSICLSALLNNVRREMERWRESNH